MADHDDRDDRGMDRLDARTKDALREAADALYQAMRRLDRRAEPTGRDPRAAGR